MTAPFFESMMADLLMTYGDTVTVYSHQGYGDSDDFWQTDQDWEATGTEYTAFIEDEPSEKTLQDAGFNNEAEAAMWFDQDVVTEGDKIEHNNRTWVAISVSDFYSAGIFVRQIVGLRSI